MRKKNRYPCDFMNEPKTAAYGFFSEAREFFIHEMPGVVEILLPESSDLFRSILEDLYREYMKGDRDFEVRDFLSRNIERFTKRIVASEDCRIATDLSDEKMELMDGCLKNSLEVFE